MPKILRKIGDHWVEFSLSTCDGEHQIIVEECDIHKRDECECYRGRESELIGDLREIILDWQAEDRHYDRLDYADFISDPKNW